MARIKTTPKANLLALSDGDKMARFDAMVAATFSHVNDRDLLAELHPRSQIDIRRRRDAVDAWFEGDWLTRLMNAREGR